MLKNLHIPVRIGVLGLAISTLVCAEDRFVVKTNSDVTPIARRYNLSVVKSLVGSGFGVHVLQAPKGTNAQQLLHNLAAEPAVRAAEQEKPLKLPGLSSKNAVSGL